MNDYYSLQPYNSHHLGNPLDYILSDFEMCFILFYCMAIISLKQKSILIYDLQSEYGIYTYYMLKVLLKAHMPLKVSNEMKYINENMT